MTRKRIGVVNAGELAAKFRAMPEAYKEHVSKMLAKSADDMVRTARALAPVRRPRGGALRDSIMAERIEEAEGARFTVSAGGGRAFYARFVEFGTGPHVKGQVVVDSKGRGRKARRTHPGTRPQPFFFPAYRLLKKRLVSRRQRATRDAARQVAAMRGGNG